MFAGFGWRSGWGFWFGLVVFGFGLFVLMCWVSLIMVWILCNRCLEFVCRVVFVGFADFSVGLLYSLVLGVGVTLWLGWCSWFDLVLLF